MLDEDVNQEDSGRPLALPSPQRSEQDNVGFDVAVIAFHEVCSVRGHDDPRSLRVRPSLTYAVVAARLSK
jgi:hypothetical protein